MLTWISRHELDGINGICKIFMLTVLSTCPKWSKKTASWALKGPGHGLSLSNSLQPSEGREYQENIMATTPNTPSNVLRVTHLCLGFSILLIALEVFGLCS